jgi:hypothetical protein
LAEDASDIWEKLLMTRYLAVASTTLSTLMVLVVTACGESPKGQTQSPASTTSRSAASTASTSSPAAPLATDQSPTTDPCTVLTDEEVQAATGYSVLNKKAFPGNGGPESGCDWALKTDAGVPGMHRISMSIRRPGGRERFNFMSSGSLEKIPEVGDGAIKSGGNTDGTFWAVSGDTLVTLRYAMPVTVSDPDPLVVPLLKTIVSRQ